MRTVHRSIRILWAVVLVSAVAASRSQAQNATEIVITGVSIPGTGGNAFSAFMAPVINNVGQVAFMGTFPGGQGIFSVNGVPVNTIPSATNNGVPVSLTVPGATFPAVPLLNTIELSGQPPEENSNLFFAFPSQVALNNTTTTNANAYGELAYLGQLNSNALQGVYGAGFPSRQTPVQLAFTGIAAPGTTSTYTSLSNPPALNDNNAAAFVANLASGGQALYLAAIPNTGTITGGASIGNPATVTLLAQTGSAAPGAAGNVFFSFTANSAFPISLVSIPNSATNFLAFQAEIFNNGNTTNGIFVGSTSSSLSLVAQTTAASPLSGYTYTSFFDPVSLGAAGGGQVAFRATLTNPAAATPGLVNAAAIFVAQNGGAPIPIAATSNLGSMLSGMPLPINYSTTYLNGANYLGFGGPAQSLDGQVAFPATLSPIGLPGGGSGGGGIFLWKSTNTTSVTHIAVSGDIAPGTGGATYANFFNDAATVFLNNFNDTSVAINDHVGTGGSHEVAFQAYLAGTGVNGTNNQALFIANDQLLPTPGNTTQTETAVLARTGELLTVNPGVTKTIASFTPFYTRTGNGENSFNDLGELTVAVTFVEGGSGIYVFAPDLHLSPFTVTNSMTPVSWGTPGSSANPSWTFAYNPAGPLAPPGAGQSGPYRVVIDPADVGLATITVNGPTISQSIPALQVSSNTGIAHFVMQSGVTLTLGGGAITSGINVLTIQGPSDITTGSGGSAATLKLLGDVTSLAASGTVNNAGNFTATIAPNIDLGNVPFPVPAPTVPPTSPPPSTADVDRFRTFNVARGNFIGSYPVDLLLSGNIVSPSETVTVVNTAGSGSTAVTNDVHRGILKTGAGTLQLTGVNTFGPDTTITDDPYTTGVTINGQKVSFLQSIDVTGGLLSFANDGNLGLAPGGLVRSPPATTITVTNPYYGRWITLDGGALGLNTSASSTLANPTILDANRGIAVGPVTGFGSGTIDVFGTNVLDYEGIIGNNTNGITTGIGTLIKTGTGTLILSGPNTYSGGTIINGGTLQISNLGNIANGSVVDNGVLAFKLTTNTFTISQVISGSGAVAQVAGSINTLVLTGTNTYAGGTILGPGTVSVSSDANLGSESGPLFFNGGTLVVTGPAFTSTPRAIFWNGGSFFINSGAPFTVSQSLSSSGSPAPLALGGGTLILTGTNTFTGGVSIGGGELSVSSDANLGAITGGLTIGAFGTLQITGTAFTSTPRAITWGNGGGGFDIEAAANSFTVAQNLLEPAPGTLNCQLMKFGPGTLVLSGTNTYLGGTYINAGELSVSADTNLGDPTGHLIFQGGILQVTGTAFTSTPRLIQWMAAGGFDIASAANTFTVAQNLGGLGNSLTKLGAGTLVLTGTNGYTGGTFVDGGELQISSINNIGGTGIPTPLTFNGGLLKFGAAFDVTLNSPGFRTVTFQAPGGGGFDTNGFNITLTGPLTGAGSMTKTGNGTLTLASTTGNSYSGGTIVNQGTLQVVTDNLLGVAGAPVTVNSTVSTFGTLTYTGPGTAAQLTTTRPFTLNGGVLSAAANVTVTLNNTTVAGGYIDGPGAFATSAAAGASTSFLNGSTLPAANVTLNGADTMFNFNQGGQLNIATGITTPATLVTLNRFTNQSTGSITAGIGGAPSQVSVSNFQSSGVLTMNPASVTGQHSLITNNGPTPMYFNSGSRTFISTPAQAGLGNFAAGIDLHGQNAIVVGGLFVNNGFVVDSSMAGTATVIADFGSLVKGAGFFQNSVITQNGGKFQTGNCPGATTFGNFVFGPGGVSNDIFDINNATGVAGPSPDAAGYVSGWSNIKAIQQLVGSQMTPGNFTWTATPADPLQVALDTLVNPTLVGSDVAAPMANFDPTQAYSWQAAQWSGTYSGPTDSATLAADTTFNTSGFLNSYNGTFGWSLDQADHTLSLTYTPSPVPEPGTLALVGLAAAAGWGWRRRR